jgi:ArsR family transcriptional regulator
MCNSCRVTSRNVESITLDVRSQVFAALGDPIRLRVLDELTSGARCVCELQTCIDVAPSLLSYHLRVLREASLVEASKRGRWVDYRLEPTARRLVQLALPAELMPEIRQ